MQVIADADFAEYERLKTLEEKYNKADEILGKILQIFLADIGIRAKKLEIAAALPPPAKAESDTREPNPPARAPPPLITASGASATVAPKAARPWIDAEKELEELRAPEQVNDFLKQAKVDDFGKYLHGSTIFTNASHQLEAIRGRFEGVADVTRNGSQKQWELEFVLRGRMDGQQLRGRFQIEIKENGKTISKSTNNGEIDDLREFGSESRALIVETGPGRYFQFYYAKQLDALVGNIYERDSASLNYVAVGTFRAFRKH